MYSMNSSKASGVGKFQLTDLIILCITTTFNLIQWVFFSKSMFYLDNFVYYTKKVLFRLIIKHYDMHMLNIDFYQY